MTATRREQLRRALENVREPEPACPEAPLADFDSVLQQWLEQRCAYQERYRGGVSPLHLDYILWCRKELEVPCSLSSFQDWLALQGFQLDSLGLVHALVLKVDLWAHSPEKPWKQSMPN
jgi:hypothetical protein